MRAYAGGQPPGLGATIIASTTVSSGATLLVWPSGSDSWVEPEAVWAGVRVENVMQRLMSS